MEEVIDLGQAEPKRVHQRLAMRVIALTQLRKAGIGSLPEPNGKGEGVEALGGGVAEALCHRAAVLTGPNLVEGGLDHGEKVPAVGSKYVEGVTEYVVSG